MLLDQASPIKSSCRSPQTHYDTGHAVNGATAVRHQACQAKPLTLLCAAATFSTHPGAAECSGD